jgi:hypothetical protein
MSTAAPAPQRITNGYAQIPNSLIENQSFLTHAELSLALIILRRAGAAGDPIPLSDSNWEKWTGLGARQKKYAIAGLQKKGLRVDGRGDQARYQWHRDMWESYARQRVREERAKTDGRKPAAVPAKKGAMVHPACREGGCVMMQDPPAGKLVTMPAPAASIDAAWPATLAILRQTFPLVAGAFVARLVAVVRSTVGNVTDAELAHGVRVAYKQKTSQHSEGLFLLTVPEALAALRRMAVKPAAPAAGIDRAAIDNHLAKIIARVWDASWLPIAVSIELDNLRQAARSADFEQIDSEMCRLEKSLIAAAHVALTDTEREKIKQAVADQVTSYNRSASRGGLVGDQLEQLSRQFLERAILDHFGIPRLSLFFV